MKLYLDDVRKAPDDSWTLVKTPQEALKLIMSGDVELASLDHDLGSGQPTGYDLLKWIEEEVYRNDFISPALLVHSANPVGRTKMIEAIKKIKKQSAINQMVEDYNNFLDIDLEGCH